MRPPATSGGRQIAPISRNIAARRPGPYIPGRFSFARWVRDADGNGRIGRGDVFGFDAGRRAESIARADARALNADPGLRKYVGPVYWDIGGQTTLGNDGYVLSSADWDCRRRGWSAATCAKGYMREIRRKNGGIVFIHCIDSRSAELISRLLPPMIEEGYIFVRLDELPAWRRFETPPQEAAGPVVASAR